MAEDSHQKIVKVVVLGDIGRSPRMQYHSLSLAKAGLKVNIIGYADSDPLQEILQNPQITISKLKPINLDHMPQILQYVFKATWQTISLFLTLLITGKCDYVFCQNPPAIPTLPVCRFYCLVTRTKFIIDWHNYAYTIMGLKLASNSLLLKLSKYIERYFGQSSNHNLCVTYAMKEDLFKNWDIEATVLHDRPPRMFHPLSVEEKHDFFLKLSQQYPEFGCSGRELLNQPEGDIATLTAFTQFVGNSIEPRDDRPGLLFSSTSWTPDEDFHLLLEALQAYETTYNLTKKLPRLLCVITGKGPMKQQYVDEISRRNWQNVKVFTPWLESSDYPLIVGSADLGVCLHKSSSGLDLPMKIVDMFGAGLPVIAYQYRCLNELVQHGTNGYTFTTADQLARLIISWFEEFPNNIQQNQVHDMMRSKLVKILESRWDENWNLRVKKFFAGSD